MDKIDQRPAEISRRSALLLLAALPAVGTAVKAANPDNQSLRALRERSTYLPPPALQLAFPFLRGKPGLKVNLNDESHAYLTSHSQSLSSRDRSPFLEPRFCQQFVEDLHRERQLGWSIGGYGELRSDLWRGSYLEHGKKWVHMGVDLNIPAGSAVCAPCEGRVLRVDNDDPINSGWGPRIFFAARGRVVILGHLANVAVKSGDVLGPGQQMAIVGTPPHNGNWYAHVHIGCLSLSDLPDSLPASFGDFCNSSLAQLDAYCSEGEWQSLRGEFPDPLVHFS